MPITQTTPPMIWLVAVLVLRMRPAATALTMRVTRMTPSSSSILTSANTAECVLCARGPSSGKLVSFSCSMRSTPPWRIASVIDTARAESRLLTSLPSTSLTSSPAASFSGEFGTRLRAGPRPAERLGALPVALAQLLAAIGLVGVLIAVRIAAQAQLDRVELERDRKLVHRAFERKRAGRGARRAHVAGGGKVELGQLVRVVRVGALVEEPRPAGLLSLKILVLRGHRDGVVGDRFERAGARGAELDALKHGRPVADPVHLLAAQHAPHRALQRARRQQPETRLVLRPQPRAEAAPHIGRHDAHVLGLHLEHAGDVALHVLHALGLVVDGELAVPPVDHR